MSAAYRQKAIIQMPNFVVTLWCKVYWKTLHLEHTWNKVYDKYKGNKHQGRDNMSREDAYELIDGLTDDELLTLRALLLSLLQKPELEEVH